MTPHGLPKPFTLSKKSEFGKRIKQNRIDSETVWRELQYGDDMIPAYQVEQMIREVRKELIEAFIVDKANFTSHKSYRVFLKWFG